MNYEMKENDDDDEEIELVPKGLKAVLQERDLIGPNDKMLKDDMIKLLNEQEDFKEDKEILCGGKAIKKHHKHAEVIFLPKFHPELNAIECVWMRMKNIFRKNQDFKSKKDNGMIQIIHQILDNISLKTMIKCITNCILHTHAHQGGKIGDNLIKKIKHLKQIKRSHRR